jgi:hypothetical protein
MREVKKKADHILDLDLKVEKPKMDKSSCAGGAPRRRVEALFPTKYCTFGASRGGEGGRAAAVHVVRTGSRSGGGRGRHKPSCRLASRRA